MTVDEAFELLKVKHITFSERQKVADVLENEITRLQLLHCEERELLKEQIYSQGERISSLENRIAVLKAMRSGEIG